MLTNDTELTLSLGDQRAVVSPYGASLRSYYRITPDGQEQEIVWGYSGSENKIGGQGDTLIPFPSRIKGGRYTLNGKTYQMEINDKKAPNAIHGFLRSEIWSVREQTDSLAAFHTQIQPEEYASRGYPFALDVSLTYSLEADGLNCGFVIENTGDEAAPVGVGFHPYFVAGTEFVDALQALIPGRSYLEFDESLIPTGRILPVEGTELDFLNFRPIESRVIDNCYTDLVAEEDGIVRAYLRNPVNGQQVTVWMDDAFPYLVVYTADTLEEPNARRALAIEPQTCATDAFNHPEWGLKMLQPGETFRGRWGAYGE